jgi:UDP-N-acetylmuramyl pentapeptide phosphotransferase/UDP-N-acetylglucosamine-1-phosphate transferase
MITAWAVPASFLASLIMTRKAARLAVQTGIVAHPDEVNKHGRPVPLLGGPAILLAVVPAAVFASMTSTAYSLLVPALLAVTLLGLAKDCGARLSLLLQLGTQLCAGLVLAMSGLTLETGFGGFADAIATAAFTAAVLNGFNFLDVQDALAGTVAVVAFAGLGVVLGLAGDSPGSIIAFSAAGSCGGFLILNRPPARVFMGDAGSFGVGLLLAALCLAASRANAAGGAWGAMLPIAPLMIELGSTILMRLGSRCSPFFGNGVHLSTWTRRCGASEPVIVAGAAAIAIAGAVAAIMLLQASG